MTTPKSWRDVLPVHPAADLFPMMAEDELIALGNDIKANGLKVPITVMSIGAFGPYFLLDGRNRLAAMEIAGLPVAPYRKGGHKYHPDIPLRLDNIIDPYAYVISTNIHRRHLTAEQRRDLIAKLLKADPNKSNRQIADQVTADHKTVGGVRSELEQRGEIPHVSSRTNSKGRKQPAKRKPRSRSTIDPDVLQKELAAALADDNTNEKTADVNALVVAWDDATDTKRVEFLRLRELEVMQAQQRMKTTCDVKSIADRAEARSRVSQSEGRSS